MREFSVEDIERLILSKKDDRTSETLKPVIQTRLKIAGLSRQDYLDILCEIENELPDVQEEFLWLNLLQDLWESHYFEARLLGLQLMMGIPELVDSHLWGMLDHWSNGVDNWVLADWLGHIRAIAIHKSPALVMRMAPWLQSVDPWRRRSAIVSLVYLDEKTLERKLLLEPQEVFAYVEPVIEEHHPAVRQALVWLLQEVGRQYPADLSEFLALYRSRLPREVIDATVVNMPAELQQKFAAPGP